MAERELSPQGYIITKDPVNVNAHGIVGVL